MAAIVINIAGSYDDKALGQAQRDLEKLKAGADVASTGIAGAFGRAGDKLKSIGTSISSAGTSMTKGVTLPIVGIGIAAAVAFDKVDEGLDTVAARSGFTGDALTRLQDSFKTVSGTATQSLDEVSEVVGGIAGKLDLQGPALETFSTKVLDLARVTGTDAATAANSLTTAMGALGVGASDAAPLMDALLAASQQSGLTIDTLTAQLTTAAPAFATYGIGVEESVGLLAAFGKTGIPSTRIVAGLSTAFKNLREDGVKDLPKGLEDVFTKIKDAKDPAKATAIAVETFGSRVGVTMADAIRNGKVSLEDLQTGLKGTEGSLDRAVAATEGPQEQFARLKNQATLLGAGLAEIAMPIVSAVVPALQSLVGWFKQLDPGVKEMIVKFAAFTAIIGPVLLILGKMVTGLGFLVSGIGSFIGVAAKFVTFIKAGGIAAKLASVGVMALNAALSVNPIIFIVIAVVALVAALVLAYHKIDWFRNIVDTAFEGIKTVVGKVADWFMEYVWPVIQTAFDNIKIVVGQVAAWFVGYVWPAIQSAFGYIQTALGVLWNAYKAYWTFIFNLVKGIADWFMQYLWPIISEVFGYIQTALGVLWNVYKTAWTGIFNVVKLVVGWFMDYVWPVLQTVFGYIQTALGVLWNVYKTYWTFIWNILKTVINWIVANLWPKIQAAFDAIGPAITVLWSLFKQNWTLIWNILKNVIEWITDTLWPLIRSHFDLIKTAVQTLWEKFQTAFNLIKNHVRTVIDTVLGILRGIGDIVATVIGFFDKIRQGIVDKFNAAVTFVTGIPGKILAALGSVASTLFSAGSDLIGGLIEGIKARAGEVLSTIASFITDKIPQWVKDRLGISSPSKVMMDIGKWIPAGLAKGIAGAAGKVRDAMRKVAEATTDEARKTARDALKEARQAAADLATQTAETIRDSAVSGLDRVKDKAREVLDYVRGVRDDIKAFGGITGSDMSAGVSADSLLGSMRDRLRQAEVFASIVGQVESMGLNKSSLQEILSAGPMDGARIAQALFEGGPGAIAEVNALEALLSQAGTRLGDIGARANFGMDSAGAQGVLGTQVKVEQGAIVLNFGAGTTEGDRTFIQTTVEKAVRDGLVELARELQRA